MTNNFINSFKTITCQSRCFSSSSLSLGTLTHSISTLKQRLDRGNPLIRRVLDVTMVSRVTGGGKIRSNRAVVVLGNQNGLAGFGIGRAPESRSAIQKATEAAYKNLSFYHRLESRTLLSDMDFKFNRTNLELRMGRPGYGIVANEVSHEVFRAVGISDVYCKVRGSTNPMNVVQATFKALEKQRTPAEMALLRGKKVVDLEQVYYGQRKTRV